MLSGRCGGQRPGGRGQIVDQFRLSATQFLKGRKVPPVYGTGSNSAETVAGRQSGRPHELRSYPPATRRYFHNLQWYCQNFTRDES